MATKKVLDERFTIAMLFALTGTSFAYILKQRIDGVAPSLEKKNEHFNSSFLGRGFIWVKERTSATKAAELADMNEQEATQSSKPELHQPQRLPLTLNNLPQLLAQSEDLRLLRKFGHSIVNYVTQVFNDPARLREIGVARGPASREATVESETPK
eukprot:GILJ01011704.1.p1 GENE.GILJ01011704.1~~GILJ01011704.1.p1  ORF type:complete len:156 (+),score=25.99 GILJ01011704.1:113-580(+)